MEDLNDQSINPDITNFFIKHVVGVAIKLENGSTKQEPLITATVFQASNRWFLITSAHWFRKIDQLLEVGYQITAIRLVDCLSSEAQFRVAVPLSVSNFQPIMLDNFDEEIDIAIIPLSPLYIELLKRNNVQALDESTWSELPNQIDSCWLFGLPSEFQGASESKYSLKPLGLRVVVNDDCVKISEDQKYPRFFGRVDTKGTIDSLVGMSGGPILVYSNKRYWLIAIQTSWNKEFQTIEAIPINFLGSAIEEYYK